MEKGARYKVQTRYGWFSLDEGAYRDYLAGKLTWIDWPPKRTERVAEVQSLPLDVSEEAAQLRDKANKQGLWPVLQQFEGVALSPYKRRMTDTQILEMSLSVRASNGLMRAGVDTFGKLDELIKSPNGISAVRNLGAKSVKEIQTVFFECCYYKLLPHEKEEYWQQVLDESEEEQR